MSLATIALRDPKAAFCIARTLPLEGGFVNDIADPGGATSCGISLRFALAQIAAEPATIRMFDIDHDGRVTAKDIAGLTQDEAGDIYYADFWLPGWYANMQPDLLCWKCFDIAVNTGPKRAALILQKSLIDLGADIVMDASPGPQTAVAVAAQAAKDQGAALLATVRREQGAFYLRLIAKEPKLKAFQKGWAARAAA